MKSSKMMFSALKEPNFRLYFCGQAVSMIGTWAQRMAMAWLVYRLTDSVWMLGMLGFASGISMLLLAPFGGVLSDLYDRRRLMFVTQALMLVQAVVLLTLAWTGLIRPWHLICLATLLGTISAIDTPIRYSLISKLVVDRAKLPNAIALNSLLMNSARIIGPALAALLLKVSGETACFALNAATFFFMLYALKKMRWAESPKTGARFRMHFFVDGVKHARSDPSIWMPLSFVAVIGFTISQYPTLMPAIAETLFMGGPSELGTLMSCAGVGSVAGALLLARYSHIDLPKMAIGGGLVAGTAMMLLPFANVFWLGAALMVAVGGGMIAAVASTNTWLQKTVNETYCGRIMGLFSMAAIGIQPLGSIVSGAIGALGDIRYTLFLNGFVCLLAAVFYAYRRQVHRLRSAHEA